MKSCVVRALIPSLSLMGVCSAYAADDASRTTVFIQLDKNSDHQLSLDEFLGGFRSPGQTVDAKKTADLKAQFARMDTDHSSKLSLDEYLGFFNKAYKSGTAAPAKSIPTTTIIKSNSSTPVKTASATPRPAPMPQTSSPSAPKKLIKSTAPVDDDEKDEVDKNLSSKATLFPWTENQRRSVENTLMPAATTVVAGTFHYRILHVAREPWYNDTTTNLMGLDDSVKIGFLLGYGISKNFDVNVQRTNGRTLQLNTTGTPVNMDYWDVLFKYKMLDQNDALVDHGGIFDASLVFGGTYLLRNRGKSDISVDAELILERDFFNDRLRLGVGVAYAGLSVYEPVPHLGPSLKLLPEEYEALSPSAKAAAGEEPKHGTLAIPVSAKIALTEKWQLFGEAVFPKSGYRTGEGPSTVAGFRYNTHTHEYSFYVANTANVSFNGAISGGADHYRNLPFFGFSIVAHLP